ncbi:MAG TPA: hypothetical protein VLM42_15670 [Bryobacteraceae bacterium]|nr:hypothetical protein [Bryobacteraceae bacterium]
MSNKDEKNVDSTDCVVPQHAVPAEELGRYSVERDSHRENDISQYVESEARGETIKHVEKIKEEVVLGEVYEIWDVTTDQERWWVLTNLTNLYSQRHFPSLDYTLSFHIGLMMRLRSRPEGARSDDPSPFDDVFRRQQQAKERFDAAVEAEDYQAVGMQLRECLISLAGALRRRISVNPATDRPQDANFIARTSLVMDQLVPGHRNKELRQYLKGMAKDTWQLVNWLTHDRDANKTASSVAIHGCDTVVGHFVQILERGKTDHIEECPVCKSRKIRTHFDVSLEPEGEYYMTCAVCEWSSHPGSSDGDARAEGDA